VRFHSSFLEDSDFRRAARTAGVGFTRFDLKGSRSRDRAWDIILTGSSSRNQNMGGEDKAATWDEWGVFLGALFNLDPTAVVPKVYEGGEHYHWSTGNRFLRPLSHEMRHRQHKWEWTGRNVTGAYTVHECQCGALMRRMLGGRFADLA